MAHMLQVDNIVVAMTESLREQAVTVAQFLRKRGESVELVLQAKKMKQNFKVAPSKPHGLLIYTKAHVPD